MGRVDQLLKVKGLFMHPGQLQKAMQDFPEVTRYCAVATRDGTRDQLTLYVAQAEVLDAGLTQRLQERLRKALRLGVAVAAGDDGRFPEDGQVLVDERTWD